LPNRPLTAAEATEARSHSCSQCAQALGRLLVVFSQAAAAPPEVTGIMHEFDEL